MRQCQPSGCKKRRRRRRRDEHKNKLSLTLCALCYVATAAALLLLLTSHKDVASNRRAGDEDILRTFDIIRDDRHSRAIEVSPPHAIEGVQHRLPVTHMPDINLGVGGARGDKR